jgi:hypothetical protein
MPDAQKIVITAHEDRNSFADALAAVTAEEFSTQLRHHCKKFRELLGYAEIKKSYPSSERAQAAIRAIEKAQALGITSNIPVPMEITWPELEVIYRALIAAAMNPANPQPTPATRPQPSGWLQRQDIRRRHPHLSPAQFDAMMKRLDRKGKKNETVRRDLPGDHPRPRYEYATSAVDAEANAG